MEQPKGNDYAVETEEGVKRKLSTEVNASVGGTGDL